MFAIALQFRAFPSPAGWGLGWGETKSGCSARGAMANQLARKLRKTETVAEKRLWQELRKLRARGYHFRRQHPIDFYIVDFAGLSQMLIIEVDGCQHVEAEHATDDSARDRHLRWRGYTILRFNNGDVRDCLDGVMLEVLAALGAVAKSD